jgi:hypothetical protein
MWLILTLEATQKAAIGAMLPSCSAGNYPCAVQLAQYDTGKGQIGLTNVKKLGVGINALIFRGIPIGHKANILN